MIEIVYELKADRHSEPEIGYTYFVPKSQDFKEVVTEATKHFKKFCTDNGWTRKATLKTIQLCKNESTPPPVRTVAPNPPRNRRRTRASGSTRSPRKTSKTSTKRNKVQ